MLVLSLKDQDKVFIDGPCIISVSRLRQHSVILGLEIGENTTALREEVLRRNKDFTGMDLNTSGSLPKKSDREDKKISRCSHCHARWNECRCIQGQMTKDRYLSDT